MNFFKFIKYLKQPDQGGNVCTLAEDAGECYEWELKWRYDYEKQYCTQFYWGGCGGNDNRL